MADDQRGGTWPLYGVFFMEAFVLGNWIPRIPDGKEHFDLTAGQLGALLLCISSGTLIAFLFGTKPLKRHGLRLGCMVAGPAWALTVMAIPLPNHVLFGAVIAFAAGASVGLLEIAMNTAVDRLEQRHGRRYMSKAHGFWSMGSLAGAGLGALFATWGWSIQTHFLAVLIPSAAVAWYVGFLSPRFRPQVEEREAPAFKLPSRSIVLLCIMPIGIMLVEGAFIDWSALFVKEVLNGGPQAIGGIFAAFAAVMTVTRLSGDWLQDQFSPLVVARVSAVCAAAGIALFAASTSIPMAFVAAGLSGLGVAIFYPLAMTAAARRPGDEEDNVAAMSMIAFTSFMIAPPAIGFLADGFGLPIALGLLVPFTIGSLVLTGELKK
ncbi:MAG: MFS transporter [Pseudomonadota bacterium]